MQILIGIILALSPAPPPGPPEGGPAVSHLAVIGPAPPSELSDAATGEPLGLADLRGRVVVVSFVYTTCNGSCPATTHGLYRVQEALREAGLWDDRVAFLSITLDPARDTPEVLRQYARLYSADPERWHFLTGPPERVAAVIRAWDMWARVGPGGTLDHPSRIFLVDPAGRQREIYNLAFLRPEAVVADVRALLDEVAAP